MGWFKNPWGVGGREFAKSVVGQNLKDNNNQQAEPNRGAISMVSVFEINNQNFTESRFITGLNALNGLLDPLYTTVKGGYKTSSLEMNDSTLADCQNAAQLAIARANNVFNLIGRTGSVNPNNTWLGTYILGTIAAPPSEVVVIDKTNVLRLMKSNLHNEDIVEIIVGSWSSNYRQILNVYNLYFR